MPWPHSAIKLTKSQVVRDKSAQFQVHLLYSLRSRLEREIEPLIQGFYALLQSVAANPTAVYTVNPRAMTQAYILKRSSCSQDHWS